MKLNQQGALQYFLIFVLFLGLAVGLYLVQQRTNLLPKAYDAPSSVEELSNEQAVPLPDPNQCDYAPKGKYQIHAKLSSPHRVTINVANTVVCSKLIGTSYSENLVGTLAFNEEGVPPTGVGDRMTAWDTLDRLCSRQGGLTGPICELCRQKIKCEEYYVGLMINPIEDLRCSTDSSGRRVYHFSGQGEFGISTANKNESCKITIEEQNVKIDVDATYLKDYTLPIPGYDYGGG